MPEFQTNAAFRKDSTFHRANDHNLGSYSRLAVSYEHAFSQGGRKTWQFQNNRRENQSQCSNSYRVVQISWYRPSYALCDIQVSCKKKASRSKNIQQRGFASGHPPNYYRGGFQKFLLTGVSRLLPKYYRSLDRPVPPPLLVLITALKSDYFLNIK